MRRRRALRALLTVLLPLGVVGCGALVGGTVLGVRSSGGGGSSGVPNAAPAATILEPSIGVTRNDRIQIRYLLIDGESQSVDVSVTYQVGEGPFLQATPVVDFGHDGTTGLTTLPGGVEHLFVWNSSFDLGDVNHVEVRVRIAPTDVRGAAGALETSAPFSVLNRRISTFAGGEVRGDLLIGPSGLWLDESSGLLYVADDLASKVQAVDLATLEVTLVAGNDLKGYDEDDLLASTTSLDDPSSVLRLGDFLYVGTAFRVRAIRTSTGFIKTVIGTGVEESSGDGGFPDAVGIEDQVFGLAHDSLGNLYFTEESHLRVWNRQAVPISVAGQVVETGTVETIGEEGDEPEAWQRLTMDEQDRLYVMSPDGLYLLNTGDEEITLYEESDLPVAIPPGEVRMILGDSEEDGPEGSHALLLDLDFEECNVVLPVEGGRYLFSAEDHRIREVDMIDGTVRIVAGTGIARNDGDGGPASLAAIHQPRDIALSRDGMLYMACTSAIRAVNLGQVALPLGPDMLQPGEIATVASSDPGDFLVADDCLAIGPDDSVYTMDSTSKALIQVHPDTRERTVVVGAGGDYAGDGGPAARASSPGYTLVIDSDGNLVIGSRGRVRVVNRQSAPIVVAGVTILPGHIDTIAGDGDESFTGDGGPALGATLSGPEQIALDAHGCVYLCDEERIRVVNTGTAPRTVAGVLIAPGHIDTVVGIGEAEECDGDGGPAIEAACAPIGVSVDASGNIYLVDGLCAGVRVVNVTGNDLVLFPGGGNIHIAPGTIETIVGTGEAGRFTADGLSSLETRLTNPRTVLIRAGDLLISDAGARRLRRVDADTGLVTTVVGTGESGYNGDAIPLENVRLAPELAETDSSGRIYVLDGTGRVRRFLSGEP